MELPAEGACRAAAHAAVRRTCPLPANTVVRVEVLEIVEREWSEKHEVSFQPCAVALRADVDLLVLVFTTFTIADSFGLVNQNSCVARDRGRPTPEFDEHGHGPAPGDAA
jgi:hypothetical protein